MEVDNEEYFKSYEDLDVHELMLKDKPRNEAYRNAIMSNKKIFEVKRYFFSFQKFISIFIIIL